MTGKARLRSAAVAKAKQLGGPAMTVKARCLMRGYELPRWGNLRRTTPFSSTYGFERGQPIDRYYLHKFLAAHRHLITGDVLETQGSSYTERFGHALTRADSFDIEPRFQPTPDGWREKLAAAWAGTTLEIASHGNCLAAVGAQLGLALEELSEAELDVHDPRFPVLTTTSAGCRDDDAAAR